MDVIGILTGSDSPRKYWNQLSVRLKKEGSQLVTKCHQLKLIASDGKMYPTDVADTETLLRLIQSIPSPKAELFKLWLAKVGYEITKAWADKSVKEYKKFKSLNKENLKDNMTNLELVLNMLAKTTTTGLSKIVKPNIFNQSKIVAKEGGTIAGNTRKEIEDKYGENVIIKDNAKKLIDQEQKKLG